MNVNKQVIASTLVIMAVGIVHAWQAGQGITVVVMGGYGVMIVLGIIDMFGGGMQKLASALSLLAVVFVILLEGLPIIQNLTGGAANPTGSQPTSTNTSGHGPANVQQGPTATHPAA